MHIQEKAFASKQVNDAVLQCSNICCTLYSLSKDDLSSIHYCVKLLHLQWIQLYTQQYSNCAVPAIFAAAAATINENESVIIHFELLLFISFIHLISPIFHTKTPGSCGNGRKGFTSMIS